MVRLFVILMFVLITNYGCQVGDVTQEELMEKDWTVTLTGGPIEDELPVFNASFDEMNVYMTVDDEYIENMVDDALDETGMTEMAEQDSQIRNDMKALAELYMESAEQTFSYSVKEGTIKIVESGQSEDSYDYVPMKRNKRKIVIESEPDNDLDKSIRTSIILSPK